MENKRKKNNPKIFSRFIFAFLFFFLSLLFTVWSRYHGIQMGYELKEKTLRVKKMQDEERALKIEFHKLSSLDRIEEIARRDFGLRETAPHQVVFLTPEKNPLGGP